MKRGRPSPEPPVRSSSSSVTVEYSEPLDLRYPGGKGLAGLQQWICAQLPAHVYYCEPFAGHAGVFRLKPPALRSTLIDLDSDVVTWLHRYRERCAIADPIGGGNDGADHIRILHGDGIEFLERAADDEVDAETLFYCDPPYHPSTRVKLKLYRHEMADRDHRRFLRAALRLRCPVVISGYACDLYRSSLEGWSLQTRQVITRGRTLATECLWSNAAAAEVSSIGVTYDQLGVSFRERERVSRLVKRWSDDFARRPLVERRAILLSLMRVDSSLYRSEWLQSRQP